MKHLFTAVIVCFSMSMSAQNTFQGGVSAGFILSQISGDNLSGFEQFGLTVGPYIRREFEGPGAIRLEINFAQKGSRKVPDPENGDYNEYRLRLNYAEVPVIYEHRFNDILIQAGAYLSFLLNWKEETQFGELTILDQNLQPLLFKDTDFGFVTGITYDINDNLFINGRYSGSILPVRKHPSGQTLSQALGGGFTEANAGQYNSLIQFTMGFKIK